MSEDTNKPTEEEIDFFIKTFKTLAFFEGQQRQLRGYGCFSEKEIQNISEVCRKVLNWLRTAELGKL